MTVNITTTLSGTPAEIEKSLAELQKNLDSAFENFCLRPSQPSLDLVIGVATQYLYLAERK